MTSLKITTVQPENTYHMKTIFAAHEQKTHSRNTKKNQNIQSKIIGTI